jgi:hypothetical protein
MVHPPRYFLMNVKIITNIAASPVLITDVDMIAAIIATNFGATNAFPW